MVEVEERCGEEEKSDCRDPQSCFNPVLVE